MEGGGDDDYYGDDDDLYAVNYGYRDVFKRVGKNLWSFLRGQPVDGETSVLRSRGKYPVLV